MRTVTVHLSPMALLVINIARLPGETDVGVIDRLLVMLLPIVGDLDVFFGEQTKAEEKTK